MIKCRPLLIGHAPSRTGREPALHGAAGARLAELAGLSPENWYNLVDTVNVFRTYQGGDEAGDYFPVGKARTRTASLRRRWADRAEILFVGRAVAQAFGFGELAPCVWRELTPTQRVALIPHPSGRNRWYNDPSQRAQLAAFLRALFAPQTGQEAR
jgi:hypothetical protein